MELMLQPVKRIQIAKVSDADALEEMTQVRIFVPALSGKLSKLNGQVPTAFSDFDVMHCAMLADEDLEVLQGNAEIVRHGKKIASSVRANAQYILDIRADYGNFNQFLQQWPDEDFVGLWEHLKKNGSRLGGQTGR